MFGTAWHSEDRAGGQATDQSTLTAGQGTLAIAHLFRLREPGDGFIESNREYLREVPILMVLNDDREAYEDSLSIVEPMLPWALYDPGETYGKLRQRFKETRRQFFDAVENFCPFMAFDLFNMHPEKTLAYVDRVVEMMRVKSGGGGDTASREMLEVAGVDIDYNRRYGCTREYGYGNRCGSAVLEERERKHPFVYGQYRLESVPGCEHYWRRCSCICPMCEARGDSCVYTCHMCHMNACSTGHTLSSRDVQEILCWTCGRRGPIGQRCLHCGILLSERYCKTCKVLSLMPLDYETFDHCARCNRCISIHELGTHYCARDEEAEDCPICLTSLSIDLPTVRLSCPAGHYIHAHCYEKIDQLSEAGDKCPLDGTIVGERDRYYFETAFCHDRYRKKVQKWLKYRAFNVLSCIDCGKLAFNLHLGHDELRFCHSCFGCNTVQLERVEMANSVMQTLKDSMGRWLSMNSGDNTSLAPCSLLSRVSYNTCTRDILVRQFLLETEWLMRTHPVLFSELTANG